MNDPNNDLLKQIASLYAEKYGEELKKEIPTAQQDLSRFSKEKIDRRIKSFKIKKYTAAALSCAACLLLIISLSMFKNMDTYFTPDAPYKQATEESAPAESAPDSTHQFISLSFDMPQGFEIETVEQDLGKTIYYVADQNLDDIVLTAEYSAYENEFEGLMPYTINSSPVYIASKPDYKILKFEKEDVLYTLTCKFDINTLIYFCENIT